MISLLSHPYFPILPSQKAASNIAFSGWCGWCGSPNRFHNSRNSRNSRNSQASAMLVIQTLWPVLPGFRGWWGRSGQGRAIPCHDLVGMFHVQPVQPPCEEGIHPKILVSAGSVIEHMNHQCWSIYGICLGCLFPMYVFDAPQILQCRVESEKSMLLGCDSPQKRCQCRRWYPKPACVIQQLVGLFVNVTGGLLYYAWSNEGYYLR